MTRHSDKLFLLFLAFVFGLLLYVRFNYMHIPFERDEGEYAYAGSLLLHGHLPYKEAYNMKFPGSYFMYALIMKAGGETIESVRASVCIIIIFTSLFVGLIVRLIAKSKVAGAVATCAFFALDTTMGYNGLMANSEHFVNLFSVFGVFCLLSFVQHRRGLHLVFLSGIFLCLAVIMKQYGYPFCIFGLIILLAQTRHKSWAYIIKILIAYALGGLIPLALLLFWILRNGLWTKFHFLTISYAYAYVGLGQESLSAHHIYLEMAALTLLLLVAQSKNTRIIAGWLIFSILAVATGRFLRDHYFILIFPALSVALGYAYYLFNRYGGAGISNPAAVLAFMAFFISHQEEYFNKPPIHIFDKQYRGELFVEMPGLASHINGLIPANDKLSLFSMEPELFFYSRHVAASGYIYNYPFFENQPYATQMVKEFIAEVEANPSQLFVYNNFPWQGNTETTVYFNTWWQQYSQKFYLKQVYYAYSQADGKYLDEEQLKTDITWKNAPTRFEFWMKKPDLKVH